MDNSNNNNIRMPERRVELIKDILMKEKALSIKRISNEFNVSYLTVRKDLERLEKLGIIRKVHGGAILADALEPEPVFNRQKELYKDEKNRIAEEAAKIIRDGDTIILESGSTILELVKFLEFKKDLKVSTAGAAIGIELINLNSRKKDIEVSICGGLLRPEVGTFVDEHAVRFFKEIHVDISFIGAAAVNVEFGITTATTFDAEITKVITKSGKKVILLCDSSKFGMISYINVLDLNKLDEIITDRNLDKKIVKEIENMGVKLTLV